MKFQYNGFLTEFFFFHQQKNWIIYLFYIYLLTDLAED